MAGKKQKEKPINDNWEAEIAAYDAECARIEKEFYEKHFIINESGNSGLTEEENEVFILYLNGVPCAEIAKQFSVENETITGLIELIKAKLSVI
ncbi:hypothetical protein ACFL1R_10490 [Candidatus Latescibacterota bacterium]